MDGVSRRDLDGKKKGLTWRLQESLEDMECADNICLVSHKYEHMQRKLDDLWKESKKAVLEINFSKTEEIRVNPFQSNFSANRTCILHSSYLFWAGKRLVDYL
jgi:hypothetical protein